MKSAPGKGPVQDEDPVVEVSSAFFNQMSAVDEDPSKIQGKDSVEVEPPATPSVEKREYPAIPPVVSVDQADVEEEVFTGLEKNSRDEVVTTKNKTRKKLLIVLAAALGLSGVGVSTFNWQKGKKDQIAELESDKTELTDTKSKLEVTNNKLTTKTKDQGDKIIDLHEEKFNLLKSNSDLESKIAKLSQERAAEYESLKEKSFVKIDWEQDSPEVYEGEIYVEEAEKIISTDLGDISLRCEVYKKNGFMVFKIQNLRGDTVDVFCSPDGKTFNYVVPAGFVVEATDADGFTTDLQLYDIGLEYKEIEGRPNAPEIILNPKWTTDQVNVGDSGEEFKVNLSVSKRTGLLPPLLPEKK